MAACSPGSLSLYYPPQVIADAITCSPQRGHLRANVHANFHCLIPRGNRFAFSTAPRGGGLP